MADNALSRSDASIAARRVRRAIDVHSHAILGIGAEPPVDDMPAWNVEKALALMDANEVAVAVLSVPDSANHDRGEAAAQIARRINESLAAIVSKHPSRFGAMATVPGRSIDGCLEEMAYALDILKLDGVATSTSIDDVYLGDSFYDPWFEEMNRRRVSLFIHPVIARASHSIDLHINASILEFMFDTSRMLTNMVFSGAKKRFSDVRMISSHVGGTIPWLLERIQTLEVAYGNTPGRTPLTAEELRTGFASFYYDLTAGTSKIQLVGIGELVPTSQMLFGLDIPFMPESSFAPAVRDIERWEGFTQEDINKVAHENACALYPMVAERAGFAG